MSSSKRLSYVVLLVSCLTFVRAKAPGGSPFLSLENNGYKDLVVSLSDGNPPMLDDAKKELVECVKKVLTETSKLLFVGTKQSVYFKEISILIPKDWESSFLLDAESKFERHDEAGIRVHSVNPVGGDHPYALQSGGCGEKGHYVHITSDYLFKVKRDGLFREAAKFVLRAWAQSRYGVFEECGYVGDAVYPHLYYDGQYHSTSCVDKPFQGKFSGQCYPPKSLSSLECRYVVDKDQADIASSLMYSPYMKAIKEFCTETNHNTFAPTRQNTFCQEKSTWEIIRSSSDLKDLNPLEISVEAAIPSFKIIKSTQDNYIFLVEQTKSMKNVFQVIIDGLRRIIYHEIPDKDNLGFVFFDENVNELHLDTISETTRAEIWKKVPRHETTSLKANIQIAIDHGLKMMNPKDPTTTRTGRTTLILIASGLLGDSNVDTESLCNQMKENYFSLTVILCNNHYLKAKDVIILQNLVSCSSGNLHVLHNMDENDDSFKLKNEVLLNSYFRQILKSDDPRKIEVQVFEQEHKETGITEGTFYLDDQLGHDTKVFVNYDERKNIDSVVLIDPNNNNYTESLPTYEDDEVDKLIQITLKEAKVGKWQYQIIRPKDEMQHDNIIRVVSYSPGDQSPITVRCWTNVDNKQVDVQNNPVIFYAQVTRGEIPVLDAQVEVIVTRHSTDQSQVSSTILQLLDTGNGDPDISKNDGIYSRYFTKFDEVGLYSYKVNVSNNQEKAKLAKLSGAISTEFYDPCERKPFDVESLDKFLRLEIGSSFYVSNKKQDNDLFPPARIMDLHVKSRNDKQAVLTWTAVGGDYDSGQVKEYEVLIYEQRPKKSEGDSKYITKHEITTDIVEAGETQTVTVFIPNGTVSYAAVRGHDGTQFGPLSNTIGITIASEPLPTSDPNTNDNVNGTDGNAEHNTASLSSGAIAGIVIVALVMIIVVAVVFFVTNKRRKQKHVVNKKRQEINDKDKTPENNEELERIDTTHPDDRNNENK